MQIQQDDVGISGQALARRRARARPLSRPRSPRRTVQRVERGASLNHLRRSESACAPPQLYRRTTERPGPGVSRRRRDNGLEDYVSPCEQWSARSSTSCTRPLLLVGVSRSPHHCPSETMRRRAADRETRPSDHRQHGPSDRPLLGRLCESDGRCSLTPGCARSSESGQHLAALALQQQVTLVILEEPFERPGLACLVRKLLDEVLET